MEKPLGIYKKACAEHGHKPNIVYIRPVYLDDDEKQIRKEVEGALHNFLAFNASPVDSLQDESKKAELRAKGYGFYASGALESLTKLTYDEIVEQEIGFIGTPEKVDAPSAESSGQGRNWRTGDRFEFWWDRALEVDQDAAAFRRARDAGISVEFRWRSRVGVKPAMLAAAIASPKPR